MSRFLVTLALALLLSSCAMWRSIMPGGVTPSDAEWSGVKSHQVITPDVLIDPRFAVAASVLDGLEEDNPFGVLLPLTPIGEITPRWVLCTEEYVERCRSFPLQAKVHFSGESIGPNLWRPSRLTADDFND